MAFWHKSAYEIKRYFRFNRSEKNGIIIVIVLIFLSWMGYYIYTLVQKNQPTDFSRFEKEIVQFQKSLKSDTSRNENKSEKDFDFNFPDQSVVKQKLNPFPFNPNRLPIEKWKELGLNKWQIKTILNYEAKGGKFYKKEDFRKMYCINEVEYQILEPYILIPETPRDTNYKKYVPTIKKQIVVELNGADTNELQLLRGIGSAYANRIIKYRDKLGGFIRKEQLLEVWGMDTARYNQFSANVSLDINLIRKININIAQIKDLMKHPYFDYNLARSIVKYRSTIGTYTSVEQINSATMIYKELFLKLEPYLTVK